MHNVSQPFAREFYNFSAISLWLGAKLCSWEFCTIWGFFGSIGICPIFFWVFLGFVRGFCG